MTLFSPIGQYPYPALSDVPNAQSIGQALTSALDGTTLPKFSSDSAVSSAMPSPSNGQAIMRTDVGLGTIMVYSTGVSRWVAQSSLIAEVNAVSSTTTFSNIPQYWRNLLIIVTGTHITSNVQYAWGSLTFNNDNASGNYAELYQTVNQNGSTPGGGSWNSDSSSNYGFHGYVMTGTNPFGTKNGYARIIVPGYARSDIMKMAEIWGYAGDGGSEAEISQSWVGYHSTSIITSVTVGNGGNSWTGANISLYGLA